MDMRIFILKNFRFLDFYCDVFIKYYFSNENMKLRDYISIYKVGQVKIYSNISIKNGKWIYSIIINYDIICN